MIRIENINKFYKLGKGRFHALKDVSLEIGDGEFVSVEGRSGAGKTTLLHILGCLDSFDSGTYLLNGKSVGKMGDRMLAGIRNREIGFVMQDFALISQEDVLFNIMLPLYFSHTASPCSASTAGGQTLRYTRWRAARNGGCCCSPPRSRPCPCCSPTLWSQRSYWC